MIKFMFDLKKYVEAWNKYEGPRYIQDYIDEKVEDAKEDAREEAIEETSRKEKIFVIKNMIKYNFSMKDISKATNLTKQEIDKLLKD